MLDKFFKLSEKGTTVKTEILSVVTTFLAMAYILAVCYLNNKPELIEYAIKKAKQKRMYDNSSSRIEEIKHKLESYFG